MNWRQDACGGRDTATQIVLPRDLIIMDFFLMHTVDVKTVPVWYKRALQVQEVRSFSPLRSRARKQGVGGGDTGTDTPDGVGACAPRA